MTLLNQKIYEEALSCNSHINMQDPVLVEAIKFIEEKSMLLQNQAGSLVRPDDHQAIINPLLALEKIAAKGSSPWRVVIDLPISKGTYIGFPSIQFCSAPPHYDRLIFSFKPDSVEFKFDSTAIERRPDLKAVSSQCSPDGVNNSLGTLKKFYNEAGVQRIAILGSARVFPYQKLIDEKNPEMGLQPLNENNQWAQSYVTRVQTQLNQFLNEMDRLNALFTTVNGGWAGTQEQSMGMPMISNLMGVVHEVESGGGFAPITVMPKVGAFDRVRTRAESMMANDNDNNSLPTINTYFEVDGVWGDDSKYLVGLATALLVFEPYGFWTNIEIMNGLAQNKPVAIIVDPSKIAPQGEYYSLFNNGEKYAIKKMQMPDGSVKEYRLYKNAADAAKWFGECHQERQVLANVKKQDSKNFLVSYPKHLKQDIAHRSMLYVENGRVRKASRPTFQC